jgi:hypothetical protein
MHNHADRDSYVTINMENVDPKEKNHFQKVNSNFSSNYGTVYDYFSVMHYEAKAFSINGQPTVVPKNSKVINLIGKFQQLSKGDIARINNMYNCFK